MYRDTHELNCIYTFNAEEYQNLIPCEICDDLINIEDYQTHVNECMTQSYLPTLTIPIYHQVKEMLT